MAIEDFFDHLCDIYHINSTDASPGFGLPDSTSHDHSDTPDEVDVPCHFTQSGGGSTQRALEQQLPENRYEDRIKLTLPIGTDVRVNDKVLDKRTNLFYTAEIPRNIRNHHIYVWVKREGTEVAL